MRAESLSQFLNFSATEEKKRANGSLRTRDHKTIARVRAILLT